MRYALRSNQPNETMKTFCLSVLSLVTVVSPLVAGQLDPRFDGKWQGVESLSGYFVREQIDGTQNPAHIPTVIAIGDSGQTMGVLKGLTVGRYEVSPKSHGNSLVFKVHQPSKGPEGAFGRRDGKLILSADGKTLTATSYAVLPGTGPIHCVVKGIFHRAGK